MVAAIEVGLDCISIGIVVKLITISSDCVSIDVDGGFDGRLNSWFYGGLNGWFDLAVLGYQPQQSFRQLRQEAKQTHFLQTHFTGFVKQTHCCTGSLAAL
jgi:hypothetical protein